MRKVQAPEVTKGDGPHSDEYHNHPAFGTITVSQWHGGGGGDRLFGSDLRHNTGITISLAEADLRRNLSNDWIHSGKVVAEFDLSLAQWARLVASVGDGGGVPVTLRHMRDGANLLAIPGISQPKATKKEIHGEEMAQALQKKLAAMEKTVAELGAMIEEGKTGKTALREMHGKLKWNVESIPGTTSFIYDQFAEATEKVAEDAKIEVEAHVAGMAMRLGMEHLRDMAPRISNEKDDA